MTTVIALSYQTHIKGMGGVNDSVEDILYIPAYKMELWARGIAEFTFTPVKAYSKGRPQKMVNLDKEQVENLKQMFGENSRDKVSLEKVQSAVKSIFASVSAT